MTLTATITAAIQSTHTRTRGLGVNTYSVDDLDQIAFLDGVGADQADLQYKSPPGGRTLVASATENLDWSGVLTDPAGDVMAAARIKAIKIKADPLNTNSVVVGGAAAQGWLGWFLDITDKIAIKPGDIFQLTARGATGWPVVNGVSDIFKVANGGAGTPVTYYINVLGASA